MYTILLEAIPTPRPRVTRYGVYYNKNYGKYMNLLTYYLNKFNIMKDDYGKLNIFFYFKYPKNTSSKMKKEGVACRKKGDVDNLLKGFLDALQKSNIIANDRIIYNINIIKYYTVNESRIEFSLDK